MAIDMERRAAAEAQTERAYAALVDASPWVLQVPNKALAIGRANASIRSKLRKFILLAEEVGTAAVPHSQCKKGCHACCHISVTLSTVEAEAIGAAIGVAPATPAVSYRLDEAQGKAELEQRRHFGKPCSFLENGLCSIYEHRPVACRVHVNLGDAYFCSTDIAPEDSYVSSLNLQSLHVVMSAVLLASPVADIRDFFPQGLGVGAPSAKGLPVTVS